MHVAACLPASACHYDNLCHPRINCNDERQASKQAGNHPIYLKSSPKNPLKLIYLSWIFKGELSKAEAWKTVILLHNKPHQAPHTNIIYYKILPSKAHTCYLINFSNIISIHPSDTIPAWNSHTIQISSLMMDFPVIFHTL